MLIPSSIITNVFLQEEPVFSLISRMVGIFHLKLWEQMCWLVQKCLFLLTRALSQNVLKGLFKKKSQDSIFGCYFKPLQMIYLAPFMQYGYHLYMKENCTKLAGRGGIFLSSCAFGQHSAFSPKLIACVVQSYALTLSPLKQRNLCWQCFILYLRMYIRLGSYCLFSKPLVLCCTGMKCTKPFSDGATVYSLETLPLIPVPTSLLLLSVGGLN